MTFSLLTRTVLGWMPAATSACLMFDPSATSTSVSSPDPMNDILIIYCVQHHAYHSLVGRGACSRDRIAWYRGGFEIHCPWTREFESPSRRFKITSYFLHHFL